MNEKEEEERQKKVKSMAWKEGEPEFYTGTQKFTFPLLPKSIVCSNLKVSSVFLLNNL